MKIDVDKLSDELANDDSVTDYDFWKALSRLNDQLFDLERTNRPIPMRLIQERRIILDARRKRRGE